ncbi:MAG: sensor histidine kinase [Actinomycetota bacterium]
MSELAEALRRSHLLAELPEADLAELVATGRQVSFAPGEVVIAEGSEPDAMYVLLDGDVDVVRNVAGSELLVNHCGPGDLVGELGLVHGRPRTATIRARTPVSALRIEAESLDRLIAHPRTARALLHAVTDRLDRDDALLRQHERMASLGTMAAGLLHQLNNPAAAVQRGVARLRTLLVDPEGAARSLQGLAGSAEVPDDALARSDAEAELAEVLSAAGVDRPWDAAAPLVRLGIAPDRLAAALAELSRDERGHAVRELIRGAEARAVLDEVAAGAAYLTSITSAGRPLAYSGDAALSDVDVHASIENALLLLAHKIPPDVEVVRDLDPSAPHVQGWPADLAMVWNYLLDNAFDAVSPGGRVVVRTRGSDDEVTVDIENTGPPVPPEVLEHAFEPFFTTKPVGKGTGIGLFSAHATVTRQHRGRLTLESLDGVTRVRVVLPRRQ